MRVRTALRVVALVSTLAGLVVLPSDAAAATSKKTAAKSSSKKSASSKSSAAFDPVAPSTSIPAAPATASAGGAPPQRGPTRIDFDDRLIQGQTNKSGAVYLYDRKELKSRSMVKRRESFREELVGGIDEAD